MSIVDELENAIDIVELVSRYTTLKKSGANHKAVCPFPGHNEKTPSFMVSPSKQMAYCFGCHKGGGALKFIMDIENCEFKEAIEILGNFTGIAVNTNFDKEKYQTKKNIYSLYKDAVNYYKEALKRYPEVKKYIFDRGLSEETIEKFHFGYADSGVELYNYLTGKGYDDKLISESNIFLDIRGKKDKFINRLIFPIQNARGDFVAFTARILGSGEPKYLNSPASDLYDKSNILYGLFNARHTITKKDFIIITEGQMDTISLQSAGFTNTVAVSGSVLTDKHLTLIKRLTRKVFLCFDGDNAGDKATKAALEKMKNEEFEVKIIILPSGKDPDDIIGAGNDFNEYIQNAVSPIGYYLKKSKLSIESIDEKKKALKELLEIIKLYSDNLEKDFYLREVSKLLDINMNIIYDEFNKLRFKRDRKIAHKKQSYSSEELAIGYIIINEKNLHIFKEEIIFIDYLGKELKQTIASGMTYINSLDLDRKERLKGIALEIEEEEKLKTEDNSEAKFSKMCKKINIDIFKKIATELKEKMKLGDVSAFTEYSELTKLAKKHGIK